eukprot:g17580.t1
MFSTVQANASKEMEEITQLQAQLAASHARVAELEAQAAREEHKASESKESEEIMQLQAQLSAAHTRVAEFEAQAAQDKPLAPEASSYNVYSPQVSKCEGTLQ